VSIPHAPVRRRNIAGDERPGPNPREGDVKYICLIYQPPLDETTPGREELHKEYWQYTQDLQAAGKMVGGEALESVTTATTVRVRHGETLTTDGPFAETKETLGGYYVVDCKDLDEALAWAARIPSATFGSIEVRPVADVG
jgi:hypothetical protein